MNQYRKWILMAFFFLIAGKAYAVCSVTTTGLNFGNYDVFDTTSVNSTGTITVSCDEAPPPDVMISIGQSLHSGVFDPRQMKGLTGSYFFNYNLYTDAAKKTIWGDGTGGTETVFLKNVTKNKPRTVTIYGSIPPGQNVSAGSYSDLLTVTITP